MRRTTLSLAALAVSLLGSPASLSVALGVAVVDAEGHSLELEPVVSAEEEMAVSPPVPPWSGANGNVEDLHREYNNIFRYGNRNAASHLWATFLLERAPQMTDAKLQEVVREPVRLVPSAMPTPTPPPMPVPVPVPMCSATSTFPLRDH